MSPIGWPTKSSAGPRSATDTVASPWSARMTVSGRGVSAASPGRHRGLRTRRRPRGGCREPIRPAHATSPYSWTRPPKTSLRRSGSVLTSPMRAGAGRPQTVRSDRGTGGASCSAPPARPTASRWRHPSIKSRSRHSRRMVPTKRSATAFARGARTGDLMVPARSAPRLCEAAVSASHLPLAPPTIAEGSSRASTPRSPTTDRSVRQSERPAAARVTPAQTRRATR